jgi:hypothetical protein
MAYIGLEPSNSFVSLKRQVITGDGTASYTLDHSVASVNDVAIFVNNVRQDPAGYSISGAALTLGGTIQSSDDCYVIFLGQALQTVTPDSDTITTAMLKSSAVTTAKIASSAVDLTSKVTGALPVANGGTALTSGFKNGITMVDEFRLTSNFSGNANPIASNLERVDSGGQGQFGTGMTESSGTFTFPSTGYYLVIFNTEHYLNADDREINGRIRVTTNNSSYSAVARGAGYINGTGSNTHTGTTCMAIIDVTDTSNVKVQFRVTVDNSSTITISDTNTNTTSMLFMRLGDT